jgi:hypothetical protein
MFIISPITGIVALFVNLLVVYTLCASLVSEVLTRCWGGGGSTLVSLCWPTEQTFDFSSPIFDRGNHFVQSGMLLIVMSWWCIVGSVLSLARLC